MMTLARKRLRRRVPVKKLNDVIGEAFKPLKDFTLRPAKAPNSDEEFVRKVPQKAPNKTLSPGLSDDKLFKATNIKVADHNGRLPDHEHFTNESKSIFEGNDPPPHWREVEPHFNGWYSSQDRMDQILAQAADHRREADHHSQVGDDKNIDPRYAKIHKGLAEKHLNVDAALTALSKEYAMKSGYHMQKVNNMTALKAKGK
jgi:hypothetical protein